MYGTGIGGGAEANRFSGLELVEHGGLLRGQVHGSGHFALILAAAHAPDYEPVVTQLLYIVIDGFNQLIDEDNAPTGAAQDRE